MKNEMGITRDAHARFFSKVDKNGSTVSHVKGLGNCWAWKAATSGDGYGYVWVGGRMLRAHRVSWAIHNGPIPEGMCVCHRCDVKLCVNPTHLFLGTKADNNWDCVAKGRAACPRGRQHHLAKLTDANVLSIRAQHAAGGVFQRELAKRFGVAPSRIADILSRKAWAHL